MPIADEDTKEGQRYEAGRGIGKVMTDWPMNRLEAWMIHRSHRCVVHERTTT